MSFQSTVVLATLVLFLIPAAICDLSSRRIPNWLTLSALAGGLSLHLIHPHGLGLWHSLGGVGIAALVYVPLYWLRGVGGGDVKLMGALGAITGPASWLVIFVITSVVNALIAATVVAIRCRIRRTTRNLAALAGSLVRGRAPSTRNEELDIDKGLSIPHAVGVAIGSALALGLQYLGPA